MKFLLLVLVLTLVACDVPSYEGQSGSCIARHNIRKNNCTDQK